MTDGVLIGAFCTIWSFLLGFAIGKFHERWEWNSLIRSGRISKPRRRGYDG